MTLFFEFEKVVDSPRLHAEIFGSGLGAVLESVSLLPSQIARVAVDNSITPPQEATLSGVVDAHVAIPLPPLPATSGVFVHSINGVSGIITIEQVDETVAVTQVQVNGDEACIQITSNLPGASGELLAALDETVNEIQASGGVFGRGMTHIENDSTFSTTGSNFQQALLLTTPSLDAGDYYITWSYEDTTEDNDNLRDTVRVRLDDSETLAQHTAAHDDKEPWQMDSGWAIRTLTAGVHTVDIDIRRGSDKSTSIRRRRLAIWRVA